MDKINTAKTKARNVAKTQAKKVSKQTKKLLRIPTDRALNGADVSEARQYIADYWQKLERLHQKDDESLLGLPNPYLVPSYDENASFDYDEMYYWDSYFMVQGMFDEDHQVLVVGILENLLDLFRRFKVIPNASRTYLMGRSQPPFLTTFIFDCYHAFNLSDEWLKDAIEVAKQEYETVWTGVKKPNDRKVYQDLSRYYDINMLHDLAEAESGWDMTPRFNRKALNYLPVDLNALLYKYETDFAKAARIFGEKREAAQWDVIAEARKRTMNNLMWDNLRGLYYDYNFVRQKRGNVSSLAAFFPMWAGMVTDEQAAALVKSLRKFENKGGMATTDALPIGQYVLGSMPTQWAYPNGWAPLQYVVIKALERYGYHKEAKRIASKWLKGNLQWFNNYGVFLEKYNVVSPDKPPVKGVYPSQTGFGWTNGVFERLCRDYIDKS
ncbi:alpha,alpha-trehalase [Candidatus Saccharibacteria bacterium]|nr:alpha,alpha-trehalase [Candidatus Saccharibacteria bacterium]